MNTIVLPSQLDGVFGIAFQRDGRLALFPPVQGSYDEHFSENLKNKGVLIKRKFFGRSFFRQAMLS